MRVFSLEFGMQLHHFKGGGGGSTGGGGSSGLVDFPTYMKNWHETALGGGPASTVSTAMNAAIGSSPFTGENAYDPDTDITAFEAAIAGFDAIIAGIDEPVDWAALFVQAETSVGVIAPVTAIPDAQIVADVDAFADQLDDEILTKVVPRFESGMRDINAVVSSAFPVGRSIIEGFRDREVAKHNSGLRLVAAKTNADIALSNNKLLIASEGLYLEATSQMMRLLHSKYGWEEAYMKTVVEAKRIKIVAKREQTEADLQIDEADVLWDIGVFRYGGNLLSSISGAAVSEDSELKTGSKIPSVIGGALSGAAAGAMIGSVVPGLGTGVGAIVGGALGASAGFL